jgi:hypothetical protein
METRQYLGKLMTHLGGDVHQEEFALSTLPHLSAIYRGRAIRLDFVYEGELVLDVDVHPPHHLRIRPAGVGARILRLFGIRPGHMTGDDDFDRRYLVDDASAEQVRAFLTPEVKALLARLEPFYRFQLTHKEYRCVKHVPDLAAYPPHQAADDIDVLIDIAALTLAT